jgi:oligopeptide/dipeptide ABC transporter ATP-binding protein
MSVEVTERPDELARQQRPPLLKLTEVKKHFPITRGIIFQKRIGAVQAVDGVDLEIKEGETLGLVGETGCGKSTLARVIMRLYEIGEGPPSVRGRLGGAAALLGMALAIAGVLLPWARASSGDVSSSVSGVNVQTGVLMLVAAILGAFGGLAGAMGKSGRTSQRGNYLAVVMGLVVLALGALNLVGGATSLAEARDLVGPGVSIAFGIGLFLALAGGAIAVVAGIIGARAEKGAGVDEGRILFDGQDITEFSRKQMLPLRREMQMIFQDPYSSLNSRKTVGAIISDPFRIHKTVPRKKIKAEVQKIMELVGLNPEHYNRYPHEFSGGQRQRIGVARALALKPRLIVCDEPVSALDVSIQAQILNLLEDLQEEFGLTYLFIAHDLSVVKHVSDRVSVMYLGRIVEAAPGDTLYRNPKHPYTGALLSAVPIPDPDLAAQKKRIILQGDVPSPIDPPSGCRFHPRCPRVQLPKCAEDDPQLLPHHPGQVAACHFPLEDEAIIEVAAIADKVPDEQAAAAARAESEEVTDAATASEEASARAGRSSPAEGQSDS